MKLRSLFPAAVLLGVVGAGVPIATRHPKVWHRVELIQLKLTGRVPEIGWTELTKPIRSDRFAHPIRRTTGLPCPVLYRTRIGDFWAREEDASALGFVVFEQSARIYENGPVRVRSGDVVLDVGAHLGSFTRFALSEGARRVIAYEPEPTVATCFERTFDREIRGGRVVLVSAAVWDKNGTVEFGGGGMSGRVGTNGYQVRAVTLDSSVAELGLDRVDFIKMDVEGAERNALAGGKGILAKFAPRMALSIYHRPDDPDVIRKIVLSARPSYSVRTSWSHEQAFFH